ncbi:prostaglandin reductase 1-like isoform X2 [Ptychodera flava]|uniref:prostaglandin reductase 1-like isoform X2 n=1 Tax=Ptychodera flava TaxID=63121 RepID=UPI00396A2898
MVKARKFVLVKHFDGFAKDSDLKLVEEELPEIKDGEFLCEAVYLSVDPYMRPYSGKWRKEGDTMLGQQVAKVVQSKHKDYPVGTNVLTDVLCGWRSHFISSKGQGIMTKLDHLPPEIPLEQALGVVGFIGYTVYFGLLDICQPKEGETLVVNAAAGAVGSLVGQVGKIKGCRVIGYAGSDEKVKYLKELGFDAAFNYKTVDLDETLKAAAPNGVDVYFDNVGGPFSVTVRRHMNKYGRISQCGAISQYNLKEPLMVPCQDFIMVSEEIKSQGFLSITYTERFPEAYKQMSEWYLQGKLKLHMHWTEGFENMPKAFFELFTGGNLGKAIVKA